MGKYLDTRDLNNRLEELKSEKEDLQGKITEIEEEIAENENGLPQNDQAENLENTKKELQEFEDEDGEELKELEEMESEISQWNYGETLIPESDFVVYCEEMLKDCGDIPREIPWYIVIDWEQTAENIKGDYSEFEYQGETYLYRNC